ncbi:hypothetical protein PI125_g21537 [Phytophthora idaei]|nr:hypothetical protein PI125_g21537 [Phytophthora idaei]
MRAKAELYDLVEEGTRSDARRLGWSPPKIAPTFITFNVLGGG